MESNRTEERQQAHALLDKFSDEDACGPPAREPAWARPVTTEKAESLKRHHPLSLWLRVGSRSAAAFRVRGCCVFGARSFGRCSTNGMGILLAAQR